MSEQLSAAAAALGLPEALVQRSAEARAAETGASADDILAQWASGEAAPATAPPEAAVEEAGAEEATAEEAAPAEEAPDEPVEAPPPAPQVVIEDPGKPAEAPTPAPVGPYKPPVLVGAKDYPMAVLAGVVGLFVIVVMVGMVGPAIPTDLPGARSSEIDFSEAALQGREVFAEAGCAACHTQMVRPVVADVGLGPVTLNDSNQVLGTRRFGPDLANVGARMTGAQMEAIVTGLSDHPPHSLDPDNLSALIAYLSESTTSSGEEDS
jgi:cytochrome c oxidase cbb3-type subunit II